MDAFLVCFKRSIGEKCQISCFRIGAVYQLANFTVKGRVVVFKYCGSVQEVLGMDFHITQPGSSVATSLIDGESKAKHVLLLEIKVRGGGFLSSLSGS